MDELLPLGNHEDEVEFRPWSDDDPDLIGDPPKRGKHLSQICLGYYPDEIVYVDWEVCVWHWKERDPKCKDCKTFKRIGWERRFRRD